MEQQTQKKAWVTPELIVLVRSKPEEAVLAACKISVFGDPADYESSCETIGHETCVNCGDARAS